MSVKQKWLIIGLGLIMAVLAFVSSLQRILVSRFGTFVLFGTVGVLVIGISIVAFVSLGYHERESDLSSSRQPVAEGLTLSRRRAVALFVAGGLGAALALGGILLRYGPPAGMLGTLNAEEFAALRALGRELARFEEFQVSEPEFRELVLERPTDDARAVLMPLIRDESENSVVVRHDGWIIPRTAARIALVTL
jgi:hypothetical protein